MAASGPGITDIKLLFARSGNRCAFPKCRAPMAVNESLTGEVCHIKGARPVEGFLTGEGMKFSYDPSLNAILANAPCLKGSGIVIKSLGLTFRFNSDSKLGSIESHVHLTGP